MIQKNIKPVLIFNTYKDSHLLNYISFKGGMYYINIALLADIQTFLPIFQKVCEEVLT